MVKYFVVDNEENILMCHSLREIEKKFNIDHSQSSKLLKKRINGALDENVKLKDLTIYKTINSEEYMSLKEYKLKYKYIFLNNEKLQMYNSIRKIEEDTGIDHSAISKYLNGKSYKSIGNDRIGRPNKKDEDKDEYFDIFRLV
tara:strand:+ start:1557 stop:1985 length:429 start_codon:yes stop_codon:yes gene_type:complete